MSAYYVSQATGNDSNDGLTEFTPFATFDKAYTSASNGDTIYLYGGRIYLVEEQITKYLTVSAWPNDYDKPILVPNFTVPAGQALIYKKEDAAWGSCQFTNIKFIYSTNYEANSWFFYANSYAYYYANYAHRFYNCDFIGYDGLGNRGVINGIYAYGSADFGRKGTRAYPYNCNFIGLGGTGYALQTSSGYGAGSSTRNCIFYDCNNAHSASNQYDVNSYTYNCCFYGNTTDGTIGLDAVLADPLFASTTSYKLSASSPCVDTGKDLGEDEKVPPALGSASLYDIGSWGGRYNLEDGPCLDLNIYVTAFGDDDTGDGTSANPFATIDKAVQFSDNSLSSYGTINVYPGTYDWDSVTYPISTTAFLLGSGVGEVSVYINSWMDIDVNIKYIRLLLPSVEDPFKVVSYVAPVTLYMNKNASTVPTHSSVRVVYSNASYKDLLVEWDTSTVDSSIVGTYVVSGTFYEEEAQIITPQYNVVVQDLSTSQKSGFKSIA